MNHSQERAVIVSIFSHNNSAENIEAVAKDIANDPGVSTRRRDLTSM